jgi:hypothetical protein
MMTMPGALTAANARTSSLTLQRRPLLAAQSTASAAASPDIVEQVRLHRAEQSAVHKAVRDVLRSVTGLAWLATHGDAVSALTNLQCPQGKGSTVLALDLLLAGYRKSLDLALRHHRTTFAVFVATLVATGYRRCRSCATLRAISRPAARP